MDTLQVNHRSECSKIKVAGQQSWSEIPLCQNVGALRKLKEIASMDFLDVGNIL